MVVKIPILFPIFAPAVLNPSPAPTRHRSLTELRFSRWNNANAERFNGRRRTLQEIEDDIRWERRFDSATRISHYYDPATPPPASSRESFKSAGSPSFPSNPSIPGKKSKYSKHPNPDPDSHPAFRLFRSVSKAATRVSHARREKPRATLHQKADVRVGEDGVSYGIEGAPFEFKYSYTETPKVKPLRLRGTRHTPFGPTTMPRPWTGRPPTPPSKKKTRAFDSFRLPPPHKMGVKPVQAPGPFLPRSGPKYVMSREEIMGEPLTKKEIEELIEGCKRTKRQMNMGRDGLTHNMLDIIHGHWRRRRVCKIKCKGVCTVDMENVRQQLEERTGGKIIYSKGGVIYLFRGRNYNYRSRPCFPLMLWRPVSPVYPRLVQKVPKGMTLKEVTEMRTKGHKLIPICYLGKNGVYDKLVKLVREAFEECELVRINCQAMHGSSDYKKIGAKLKDLVPCVLISFRYDHILMWRGRDWKSSLPILDTVPEEAKDSDIENATSMSPPLEGQEATAPRITVDNESPELLNPSTFNNGSEVMGTEGSEHSLSVEHVKPFSSTGEVSKSISETENISDIRSPLEVATVSDSSDYVDVEPAIGTDTSGVKIKLDNMVSVDGPSTELGSNFVLPDVESPETKLDSVEEVRIANENQQVTSEALQDVDQPATLNAPCTEGVLSLLQQALESGSAIVLDDVGLDADIVYQKLVTFSQSAPPGPVFRHRPRKVVVKMSEVQGKEMQHTDDLEPKVITAYLKKGGGEMSEVQGKEKQDTDDLETKAVMAYLKKGGGEKKGSKSDTCRKKDFIEHLDNVVPQGSLGVDELAKLLE